MIYAEPSRREDQTAAKSVDARLYASANGCTPQRLLDLERRNEELESFISALAHDSSALTRGICLRTQQLRDRLQAPHQEARLLLDGIEDRAVGLARLSDGLMRLARIGARTLECEIIDLSAMAHEIGAELRRGDPDRVVRVEIQPGLVGWGDQVLVRLALENLLGNAWKYTANAPAARIDVGCRTDENEAIYYIMDNGVGFPSDSADKLFAPFARLASARPYAGSGLGLATVKRVVERHGGWISASGEAGRGAAFVFSLGDTARSTRHGLSAA